MEHKTRVLWRSDFVVDIANSMLLMRYCDYINVEGIIDERRLSHSSLAG